MHKGNAVQLRLALSAAAVCAVVAAATLSGGHRGGSPSVASSREADPIVAAVGFDDEHAERREICRLP